MKIFVEESIIVVQGAGLIVSGQLKMIKKYSEKIVLIREISRVESDCREGEVLHTLSLDGGADVLGVPVPHSLHQEHRGRGQGRRHQHRPDHPDGPGQCGPLSLVEECRGFALIGWILIIVLLMP